MIHLIRVIISHFVFFGFAHHFAIDTIATGLGGDVNIAVIRIGGIFGQDFGGDLSTLGYDCVLGGLVPATARFAKGGDAFALVIGLEHAEIFIRQCG